jgi:predicted aldo/keto reductase-like oxidoreductase
LSTHDKNEIKQLLFKGTNMPEKPMKQVESVNRRDFLKTGLGAVVGSAVAVSSRDLNASTPAISASAIPSRKLGKTDCVLPTLGFGGAAIPRIWGNPLSTEDRIKLVRHAYDRGLRYFDTAGNYLESEPILGEGLQGIREDVFLVTKVETTDPDEVARAVANSLERLQTDHMDAILIHGTPGLQQMTVSQAMKIHAELIRLRDEGLTRFVGFSAHSYFDKALALVESGGFDLCMLSYGYIPRGYDQIHSARMIELRNACVARAHQKGMGIAAMKVIGAGVLGAWSQFVVPGFDRERLKALPAAAIRYVLEDDRVQMLVIGMRFPDEIDANIQTLSQKTAFSTEDRGLLAEYSAQAYDSEAMKEMKIE